MQLKPGLRANALLLIAIVLALGLQASACTVEDEDDSGTGGVGDRVTVVRVIDGDTIVIEGGARVRYIGIDAPELPEEPLSVEATDGNREMVEGRVVVLEKDVRDRDDYGRLLRYVWSDGVMVNAELVRLGYARSRSYPPDVKHQDLLDRMEDEARAGGLGLWEASSPALAPARLIAAIPPRAP